MTTVLQMGRRWRPEVVEGAPGQHTCREAEMLDIATPPCSFLKSLENWYFHC